MNILSVQSWVSYGHVGNAAALLPLQRLGIEVWAVNTVQFSNHPGRGDWRGRAANARALYCCDPVIGDAGRGVFVRPGVAEFLRGRAVPAANVVTPNHFELEFLTGRELRSLAALKAAVADVHDIGQCAILV